MGYERDVADQSPPLPTEIPVISEVSDKDFLTEELPSSPGRTYSSVYEFDVSLSRLRKLLVGTALFGALLLLAAISRWIMLVFVTVGSVSAVGPIDPSTSEFLLYLIALAVVWIGGHELIHASIAWWYGWSVSVTFHPWLGYPAVVSEGAYQTRRETAIMLLAPLVVITVSCVGLLGVAAVTSWVLSPYVVVAALLIVVYNAAASIIDVFSVWKLGLLPSGSLLYNTSHRTLATIPVAELDKTD